MWASVLSPTSADMIAQKKKSDRGFKNNLHSELRKFSIRRIGGLSGELNPIPQLKAKSICDDTLALEDKWFIKWLQFSESLFFTQKHRGI